jgi:alpha-glucosidase
MPAHSMNALRGWHQPVSPFVTLNAAGPLLSLWLQTEHWPERVLLRSEPDNEEWLLDMSVVGDIGCCRHYQVQLPLHQASPRQRYSFKLLWSDRQCWFGPEGLSAIPIERLRQFCLELPASHPHWVADQIFYQIFPDRFAPGQGAHLVREAEYQHHARQRWVRRRDWEHPLELEAASSTFYGGDLDAITGKLDYLQGLGVTALYLNPIFTAPTVHKYDTEDYFNVDPHFGGNPALVRLRQATRERGMRLILDGVFNHSGDSCRWFDRYRTGDGSGADASVDSPYRNWYSFGPQGALGWKGNTNLPKLNFAEPGVVDTLYRGRDSVVRHWLREPYAIDGWRLDVVHMLGESGSAKNNLLHVGGIYQAAREENPQAYLLGEHFADAREWLQAGVEDGAMNYMGFALPVRAFLAGQDVAYQPIHLDARQCAEWMEHYRAGLSHGTQLCQFNQLDSHDTSRFLTLLQGNIQRMKLAIGWLFSWIGVPCLYYGDEIGLAGGNDPFCRAPFPWDQACWNGELLAHTQQLARLRQQSPALRRGALQVLQAEGDTLVFVRLLDDERILVVIQREGSTQLTVRTEPLIACPGWQRLTGSGEIENQGADVTLRLSEPGITLFRGFTR